MTTGRESLCCLEVPNTDPKMKTGKSCILKEEDIKYVCNCKEVIKTAMVAFLNDNGPIPVIPGNE